MEMVHRVGRVQGGYTRRGALQEGRREHHAGVGSGPRSMRGGGRHSGMHSMRCPCRCQHGDRRHMRQGGEGPRRWQGGRKRGTRGYGMERMEGFDHLPGWRDCFWVGGGVAGTWRQLMPHHQPSWANECEPMDQPRLGIAWHHLCGCPLCTAAQIWLLLCTPAAAAVLSRGLAILPRHHILLITHQRRCRSAGRLSRGGMLGTWHPCSPSLTSSQMPRPGTWRGLLQLFCCMLLSSRSSGG